MKPIRSRRHLSYHRTTPAQGLTWLILVCLLEAGLVWGEAGKTDPPQKAPVQASTPQTTVEAAATQASSSAGSPEALAPGTPAGLRVVAFEPDTDVSQVCGLEGWLGGEGRCVDRVKVWNPWLLPEWYIDEARPRAQLPQTIEQLSKLSFLLLQDVAARWTTTPEGARLSIDSGLKDFGAYRMPLLSSTFSRWAGETIHLPPQPAGETGTPKLTPQELKKQLRSGISLPAFERWLKNPLCPGLTYGSQDGLVAALSSPTVSPATLCTDSFSRTFKIPGQDRYRQGELFAISRSSLEGPFLDQLYPVHLSAKPPWFSATTWLPLRAQETARTPAEIQADMASAYGLMRDAFNDTIDQLLRAVMRYGPSTWSSVQLRTLGAIASMHAQAPFDGADGTGRVENSGDLGNTDPIRREDLPPRTDSELQDETDPEWRYALASFSVANSQRELRAWMAPGTRLLSLPLETPARLLEQHEQLWFEWLPRVQQTVSDARLERLTDYPLGAAIARTLLCHAEHPGDDASTRRERCMAPIAQLPVGLARRFPPDPGGLTSPPDSRLFGAPDVAQLLPSTLHFSDWEPLLIRLDRDERDGLRARLYGLILSQLVANARILELKQQLIEMVLPGSEADADYSLPDLYTRPARPRTRFWRTVEPPKAPPFNQEEVSRQVHRLVYAWAWIWAEQLPEDFSQLPSPKIGRHVLELLALQMLDWMSVQGTMRTPGDLPLWAVQSSPATERAITTWEKMAQQRGSRVRPGRALPPEPPEEAAARIAAWKQLYREINPSRSALPEFWPRSLHPEEVVRLGLLREGTELRLYREQLDRAIVPALVATVLNSLSPRWEGVAHEDAVRLERRARRFITEGLSTALWSVSWNVSYPALALQEARQHAAPFLALLLDEPEQLPLSRLEGCAALRGGDPSLMARWSCQADFFLSQRLIPELARPRFERAVSMRLLEALIETLTATGQRTYRRWLFQQRTLGTLANVVQGQRQWSAGSLQEGVEEGWKDLLFTHGLRGRRDEPPQRPSVNPLAVCSDPSLDPEGRLNQRSIKPITLDVLFDGPSGVTPAEALWEARGRLPFIAVDGSSAAFAATPGSQVERTSEPPRVVPIFRMPVRLDTAPPAEALEVTARGPYSHRRTLYMARWRLWSGWHTFWNIRTELGARFPILHTGALCQDTLLIEAGLDATLWRWALLKDAAPTNPMQVGQDYSQETEDQLLDEMERRRLEQLASEQQTGEEGTVEAAKRHLEDQAWFGAEEGRDLAARTSQGYAELTALQQQLQRRLRNRLAEIFQTDPQPLKPGAPSSPSLLLVFDQTHRRRCRPISEDGPQFYLRHSPYLRQRVSFYPLETPCQIELAGWGWAIPFKGQQPLYVPVTPDYEPPLNPLLPPSQLLWRPRAHQEVNLLLSVGRSNRQIRGTETSLETGDPDTVGWGQAQATFEYQGYPLQLELGSLVSRWSSERSRMALELGALTRLELLTSPIRVELDPQGQSEGDSLAASPMLKAGGGLTVGIRFAPAPVLARPSWAFLPPWGLAAGLTTLPHSLRSEWGIRGRTLAAYSYGGIETSIGLEAWQTFSIRRKRGLLQSFTPYAPRFLLGGYLGADYGWYPLAEPPEDADFYPAVDRVLTFSAGLRGQLNLTNIKPPPLPGGT